jgi:hypothetical protein
VQALHEYGEGDDDATEGSGRAHGAQSVLPGVQSRGSEADEALHAPHRTQFAP